MARYALIVGIAQYGAKGLAQLEKTTTDAEAVAQVLEQYGNFTEVKRLPSRINSETKKRAMVNQPVTANELWQAIETLLNEQARNNEALIYFTGHGLKAEGRSGKPRGYLATSDCQIKADVIKSEGNKDEPRITEVQGGVAFDDLNDLISKSELSSLVILLDCCHSGNFIESNLIKHSFGISLEKDYYLIAACRGFQTGKALKSEAHSVFTGALLRGLRAENASSDGEISCDRLYDYISRELRGASQQPLKLGWGTSIILVNHPLAIAPPVDEVPAAQAVVNRDNPYLGLMAFDADKKDYFFGRKAAVRGIGERLSKSRFLAVIGPSGCGKSSLVKAGVLPELKRDLIPDSSQWEVKIFTPGRYPLEELEQALASRESGKTFLLFIDQFEELFTLGSDESQQREFISKITEEATKIDGDTRVIVAIRGDFLDRCARYQETANLINCTQPTTYVVTPMTTAELTEAIEQPAEKHAIAFESGLVEQIIIDVVNQAGALPLLQYALAELWRVCVTDSNQRPTQLTFEGYKQIKGVKGALEKRADELYQSLAEADQKFVRCLFLELVQLGENQEVTRRHPSWQDLLDKADSQEQLERVTRQLASWNQRLIITDENKVEVAHEALLSEWRRLREWIEDNRDNIRLERRLEGDCQEWNKQNRSEGLLLTGTWLAAIDDWVNKDNPRLSLLESEFLRESLGRRDREIQEQLEQERQLRELAEAKAKAEAEKAEEERAKTIAQMEKAMAAEDKAKAEAAKARAMEEKAKIQKQKNIWLSLALGGLATVTALSISLKQQAEQRERATLEALMLKPTQLLEFADQIGALIESIKVLKSLKTVGGYKPEAIARLHKEVISAVLQINRLDGHSQQILDIAISPDNQLIASASMDKTVKVWTREGKLLKTISHKDNVWTVDFSPNSQSLASGSRDGIVKIWSIKDNFKTKLEIKPNQLNYVLKVRFSPDGKTIATANWDNSVKLWRLADGKLLGEFKGHSRPLENISFSPDGKILASTGWDHKIQLWNVVSRKLYRTLAGHTDVVYGLSFSHDGKTIASASRDQTVKVWNVTDGKLKRTLKGHQNGVNGVLFSSDNQLIISGSEDKTIKIWRAADGTNITSFKNPTPIYSLAFSPKGLMVASGDDYSITLWSLYPKPSDVYNYDIDSLLKSGCDWLHNFLKNNSKLSQEERQLCKQNL